MTVRRYTSFEKYTKDVSRIVEICNSRGFKISRVDARDAWERHSSFRDSEWLRLNDKSEDDHIFESVYEQCNCTGKGES